MLRPIAKAHLMTGCNRVAHDPNDRRLRTFHMAVSRASMAPQTLLAFSGWTSIRGRRIDLSEATGIRITYKHSALGPKAAILTI